MAGEKGRAGRPEGQPGDRHASRPPQGQPRGSTPAEQLGAMVQGISRSTSFMAKLLSAVDATLVAGAGLPAAERERARRAIDPFVLGMVAGTVPQQRAKDLFPLLFLSEGGAQRLRDGFPAAGARAWIDALEEGLKAGQTPNG